MLKSIGKRINSANVTGTLALTIAHRQRAAVRRARMAGTQSGRSRMMVLAGVAAAAAALLGPVAGKAAEPKDNKTFVLLSRCEGFASSFAMDAATIRREGQAGGVPAGFRFRAEASGETTALIGAFRCDPTAIDDVPTGTFHYGLVTVDLDCDPGSYDIWQFTSLPAYHSRATGIGEFSRLLEDLSVHVRRVAGVPVAGFSRVSWQGSPYEIEATSAPEVPIPDIEPLPSDHWYEGPRGVVHASHTNRDVSATGALVTVRAAPGTPLARMLGATTVTQPGVFLSFNLRANYGFATEHGCR